MIKSNIYLKRIRKGEFIYEKNWLTLLLAGVLCFNLTGCQSTVESNSENSAQTVSDTDTENAAYLDESVDITDYSEITLLNAKFLVPNHIVSTGDGLEDAARFTDSETYDVKARFCEINLLGDDASKVAENIENYYKEYFDATVEIDEKNCIEDHDGEKAKYIYPSAVYDDIDTSFAYISNTDYSVLFYVRDKNELFTDEEINIMLKSFAEYTGSEYSYGVETELATMTSVEDALADINAENAAREAEAAALLAEKFNNPLCAFELTVADETLTLPLWYSDLEAAGWTFKGDSSKKMSAHTSESWHEWEKDGVKLSATMTNYSINSAPYSKCIVTKIGYSLHPRNSENDIVTLPSGIQMYKSTYDDVVNAYGEPDRTTTADDEDDTLYMSFYKFDAEHTADFTFNAEDHVLIGVDLECKETLEGIDYNTSSERPAILDTYEAPSKLSDNPYDTTLELDGVVYQLPCPTEKFIENGWKIKEGNDFTVSPGSWENCTLTKGDMSIGVMLKCPTADAVTAENTYVIGAGVSFYDGSKFPLSLYGGITIGEKMTADELTALFKDMDVDVTDSKETLQQFFITSTDDSDADIEYYIIIDEGVVAGIELQNIVTFER